MLSNILTARDFIVIILTLLMVLYFVGNYFVLNTYRFKSPIKRGLTLLFGSFCIIVLFMWFVVDRFFSISFIWNQLIKGKVENLESEEEILYWRDFYSKTNPYNKLLLRLFDRKTKYKFNIQGKKNGN